MPGTLMHHVSIVNSLLDEAEAGNVGGVEALARHARQTAYFDKSDAERVHAMVVSAVRLVQKQRVAQIGCACAPSANYAHAWLQGWERQ